MQINQKFSLAIITGNNRQSQAFYILFLVLLPIYQESWRSQILEVAFHLESLHFWCLAVHTEDSTDQYLQCSLCICVSEVTYVTWTNPQSLARPSGCLWKFPIWELWLAQHIAVGVWCLNALYDWHNILLWECYVQILFVNIYKTSKMHSVSKVSAISFGNNEPCELHIFWKDRCLSLKHRSSLDTRFLFNYIRTSKWREHVTSSYTELCYELLRGRTKLSIHNKDVSINWHFPALHSVAISHSYQGTPWVGELHSECLPALT